jgi:hypothetical protein
MSQTWIIVITLIVGALIGFSPVLKKRWDAWKKGTKAQEETWTSYMKVQWVFMVVSLLLGLLVGFVSVYVGPIRSEQPKKGGVILDPRTITLTDAQPVHLRQLGRVDDYSRVTVLTTTVAPPPPAAPPGEQQPQPAGNAPQAGSGTATVTVHRALSEGRGDEIRRLESAGPTWTRWEEANPKGELSLIVEAGKLPVTVELIIYLTPK